MADPQSGYNFVDVTSDRLLRNWIRDGSLRSDVDRDGPYEAIYGLQSPQRTYFRAILIALLGYVITGFPEKQKALIGCSVNGDLSKESAEPIPQ